MSYPPSGFSAPPGAFPPDSRPGYSGGPPAKSQSTHQYQDILSRGDNSLHKMGDKCPCQEATLLKVLDIHLRKVDFLLL